VGAGSDINLVTPTIASFSPTSADGFLNNAITVSGTNLTTIVSVQFGTATPSPTAITSTSFDVLVPGTQPAGTASVVVTLGDGEVANSTYNFFLVPPTITSLAPNPILNGVATTITVVGTGFVAGLTVEFDGSPIVPSSITLTSLTIDLGPLAIGDHLVTVTHPNGLDATDVLVVNPMVPKTVFVTSSIFPGNFGGIAVADASCQSLAAGAGLTGTYKAWLSDSSSSPASSFTLDAGPFLLPDGTTVVADSWVDLTDGSLDNRINQTEAGATLFDGLAWTATGAGGLHHGVAGDCTDWTALSPELVTRGLLTSTTPNWTSFSSILCSLSASRRLYCFEQ
jgi:hypothetical protein